MVADADWVLAGDSVTVSVMVVVMVLVGVSSVADSVLVRVAVLVGVSSVADGVLVGVSLVAAIAILCDLIDPDIAAKRPNSKASIAKNNGFRFMPYSPLLIFFAS